jgi:diguanylate cyclase (GGDEF)-like protein/PAS domain S-box-containing protein
MTSRVTSRHLKSFVFGAISIGTVLGVVVTWRALSGGEDPDTQRLLAGLAMLATGAGGAAAVVDRARREEGRARLWLVVYATAGFGLFAGQALAYSLTLNGSSQPLPLVTAVPLVVFAPGLIAAIWVLGWPENLEPRVLRAVLADTATGALGLAVVWVLLVGAHLAAGTDVESLVVACSLILQYACVVTVLATAAASRQRAQFPIVQTILFQSAALVYIGANILGDLLPEGDDHPVTITLLGSIAAVALTAAFATRGVDEPDTAPQLWLRDTWSTVIPLSPVPIAAGGLVLALSLGLRASAPAALAIATLLLILIVAVMALRLAARRELRRAAVTAAEYTFDHATDQAWFQALTRNSRDMVLVIDRHVRLVYASPSFGHLVGVDPASLPGRGLSSVIPDLTEQAIRGIPRSNTSRGVSVDVSLTDHAGVDHDVAFHVSALVGLGFEGFVLTGQDVTDARRLRRLLGESRRRDRLTGLLNHEGFTSAIQEAMDWSDPRSVAVLVIDLIDYRSINDARGRRVGDFVLRSLAQQLERLQGPILAVARLSSESFGVLVRAGSPDLSVSAITQDLRRAASSVVVDAEPLRLRMAMGYATVDSAIDRAGELLDHADLAAAESRADVEPHLVRYDDTMREALLERWDQIAALELALDRGEFVPHYQPIVRLRDGAVVTLEALARRRLGGGGLQLPDDFIPLAESVGLVSRIDQVIRARALRDLRDLRRDYPGLGVSINVAPLEFRPGFAAEVIREVTDAGLPPAAVTLEITESTVARSQDVSRKIIADLRMFGCLVALDDFGTGFSSLGGLRSLEVDILKIDQSFVDDLATSPRALSLMRAITDVGRGLGLTTVAEGVRTVEQADLLRGMGCDRAQGYLHSEPLSLAQLRTWLGSSARAAR